MLTRSEIITSIREKLIGSAAEHDLLRELAEESRQYDEAYNRGHAAAMDEVREKFNRYDDYIKLANSTDLYGGEWAFRLVNLLRNGGEDYQFEYDAEDFCRRLGMKSEHVQRLADAMAKQEEPTS